MKQGKKEAVADRRSFLKLAGAGAAAGGAALMTGEKKARPARRSPRPGSIARPSISGATTSSRAERVNFQPAARRGCSRRDQNKGERHAQEEDERRREGSPAVVGPAGAGARHSGPARILEEFGARHRRPRGRFGDCGRQGAARRRPQPPTAGGKIDIKKSVCTHCSVGCTIMAEVQNGVWIGQEPGFD